MARWTEDVEIDMYRMKYVDDKDNATIARALSSRYNQVFSERAVQTRLTHTKTKTPKRHEKLLKKARGAPPSEEPEDEEPEVPEIPEKPEKPVSPPSKFIWDYPEGPLGGLRVVNITATDGFNAVYEDVDITVDITKVGETVAPTSASIKDETGEMVSYEVGKTSADWPDGEEREVAKIDIHFSKNDDVFEAEGWTKVERAEAKGAEVPAAVLHMDTQKKTDIFSSDKEDIIVVPGEKGHGLDWADGVSRIEKVTVGERKVFQIDGKDARGLRVKGKDKYGQEYVGTVVGVDELKKETGLKQREEMEKAREERAWTDITLIGFPQKLNGIIQYVIIDPVDRETAEVKTTRIVPSKGGK